MNSNTMLKVYDNMEIVKATIPYFSRSYGLDVLQGNIVMNMGKYILLTYEMIYTCLEKGKFKFNAKALKKTLRNLSDNEYLTELRIKKFDSEDILLTVYTLGRRGLGWLKAQGKNVCSIKHCMNKYMDNPNKMIKMLAANNLMIHEYFEYQFEIGKMFSADKSKSEKNKKKGRLFRAYVSFKNKDGGRTIIESVRRENDGGKLMLEKLDRIQKVAVCPDSNLDAAQNNVVILIAEDSAHAAEIITILNGISYRGFNIKITTDTDIIDEMVSFIQVTEKKKESLWRILFAA